MKLQLKSCDYNSFPLTGIFIRAAHPKKWLMELQRLDFSLEDVEIYPLPGTKANTLWGCLTLLKQGELTADFAIHERCQMVYPNLLIPEKAILVPTVLKEDYKKLFAENKCVLHPEIGLVELPEPLFPADLILPIPQRSAYILQPDFGYKSPSKINSFEIRPGDQESLKSVEDQFKDEKGKLEQPLSLKEKGKFSFLKKLFDTKRLENGEKEVSKTKLMKWMEKRKGGNSTWAEDLQRDYENLEERNQKAIDRLMDKLKNDPDEALKYAIPLDESGISSPRSSASLSSLPFWSNFSLFGSGMGSGRGGSIDIGDGYDKLKAQYHKTAEQLIEEGKYEKAAFVYIKLLKAYMLAAHALAKGGFYLEAAEVHLKYSKNELLAAEYFEKGRHYEKAIPLFEKHRKHEKVGDLYHYQNKTKEAEKYYDLAIAEKIKRRNYLEASRICKEKKQRPDLSLEYLLEGWEKGQQNKKCLKQYLNELNEPEKEKISLTQITAEKVNNENCLKLIDVIHGQYLSRKDDAMFYREMAYQLVADYQFTNKDALNELRKFNPGDDELVKDTLRYRSLKRQKR